jgi:hypothetical protein
MNIREEVAKAIAYEVREAADGEGCLKEVYERCESDADYDLAKAEARFIANMVEVWGRAGPDNAAHVLDESPADWARRHGLTGELYAGITKALIDGTLDISPPNSTAKSPAN